MTRSAGIFVGVVLIVIALYLYQQGASDPGGGSAADDFYTAWANAIATAENVNPAYNDPGGLNEAGDAGSTPAAGGGVIGIFSTFQAGFNALVGVLQRLFSNYSGDTLLQAMAIYIMGPNGAAAANGNYPANVVNEANRVASQLGVSVNDTLQQIASNF